ncbi:MAG TPA: O-antigen ligase family protein [Ligilactobacillus salivarius]|uniref:O-antigen ligase family protein n=1 Tax=Ligilactobacillus salivarius TaxID=1624 RepID=A0A921IG75_9LACO|nr:O-antigen ligase family protein [Ligilactobacillus salivarius]
MINKGKITDLTLSQRIFSLLLFLVWVLFVLLMLRDFNKDIVYSTIWFGLLLISIIFFRLYKIRINKIQKIWLIFIGYSFFVTLTNSLFGTFNTMTGWYKTKESLIVYVLPTVSLIMYSRLCNRKFFLKLIRNFLTVVCVLGIYEIITKNQIYLNLITSEDAIKTFQIFGSSFSGFYRLTLFFYHPIFYGVLLNILIAILIYMPFKNTLLQCSALIIAIINLIFTQSRSSWLAFVLILIVFIFKEHKINNKETVIKFLFGLLISLFIMVLILNLFSNFKNTILNLIQNRLLGFGDYQNNVGGARISNLSLLSYPTSILARIFGGGDNYALSLLKAHPTLNGWEDAVDNQYLTFLLDYGVIGLIIFGILIWLIIKQLYKSNDSINNAILLALISVIISGAFYEFYVQSEVLYLTYILIFMLKSGVKNDE